MLQATLSPNDIYLKQSFHLRFIEKHRQSSRLGRYRIQDDRYYIQKPDRRNSIAPHRTSQSSISNHPNHNFLVKSKNPKEYFLTSLKFQIERFEDWFPDDDHRGDDSAGHTINDAGGKDIDWQLEREMVVHGYVWGSEILRASRREDVLGPDHLKVLMRGFAMTCFVLKWLLYMVLVVQDRIRKTMSLPR